MYNNLFNVIDYVNCAVANNQLLRIQAILSTARLLWVYLPNIMKLNRLKILKINTAIRLDNI